jgi:hypothetical protein
MSFFYRGVLSRYFTVTLKRQLIAKKTHFRPKRIFCRFMVIGEQTRGAGGGVWVLKKLAAASLKSFYQNAAIS